jgi:hypothetical protein
MTIGIFELRTQPLPLGAPFFKVLVFEIAKKVFEISVKKYLVGTSFKEMFAANDWKPFSVLFSLVCCFLVFETLKFSFNSKTTSPRAPRFLAFNE